MFRFIVVFLTLIIQLNAHGQHGAPNPGQPGVTPGPGQAHVTRKMEEYVHDMEHIRHDLKDQIDKPKDQMTPEEQNFYYFKLHDTNNDNRLDGLEIVAAFNHVHHDETTNNNSNTDATPPPPVQERLADEELMGLVDDVLKEEDLNRDGYISYEEFKRAIEGHQT